MSISSMTTLWKIRFIEQLFHHLVQQPVRAYGPDLLNSLRISFASHAFSIRQLAVDVMAATALVGRTAERAAASRGAQ